MHICMHKCAHRRNVRERSKGQIKLCRLSAMERTLHTLLTKVHERSGFLHRE